MKRWQVDQLLSADEQQRLYDAFRRGRSGQSPTEADFSLLLMWAAKVRKDGGDGITRGLLSGLLSAEIDVAKVEGGQPWVRLNPIGKAYVEKTLLLEPAHRDMIRRLDAVKGTHTPLPPIPGEEGLDHG